MKEKSRTIGINDPVNENMTDKRNLKVKICAMSFKLACLLNHQYLQLRESNIDLKH